MTSASTPAFRTDDPGAALDHAASVHWQCRGRSRRPHQLCELRIAAPRDPKPIARQLQTGNLRAAVFFIGFGWRNLKNRMADGRVTRSSQPRNLGTPLVRKFKDFRRALPPSSIEVIGG